MNVVFQWQEQYLTSEPSEQVGYCSCHENIKFISSRRHVMPCDGVSDDCPKISDHFPKISEDFRKSF